MSADTAVGSALEFLWLELTNRCNLHCVHCYADSHPGSGHRDELTTRDYEDTMRQAFALGCRRLQFIGGEPQLHRDFPALLRTAVDLGFDLVEVFSNLTFLADDVVRFAAASGVRFATSVYSDSAAEHDAITKVRGSHTRTIANLAKLVAAGVTTRAGVIVIDQAPDTVERTVRFLRGMGVSQVRTSTVREFGRGEEVLGRGARMSGLCGHCWNGKLCVTPDGSALACVMSREWPVGNVRESSLEGIVRGAELRRVRTAVHDEVWRPRVAAAARPAESCPQSCDPSVCLPDFCDPSVSCPQSCEPPIIECEPGDCAPDALQ